MKKSNRGGLGGKGLGALFGESAKMTPQEGQVQQIAVGDIRAHPTGDMGSIGMASSPEPMIQTAVGGNRDENRYIELVVRGATAKVSPVLRCGARAGNNNSKGKASGRSSATESRTAASIWAAGEISGTTPSTDSPIR